MTIRSVRLNRALDLIDKIVWEVMVDIERTPSWAIGALGLALAMTIYAVRY